MWIHHIDEIAIGFFIFLFGLHFAVHVYLKIQKKKQTALKRVEKEALEKTAE